MKKVLDFVEGNVQWFAVGLGVLYVLGMTWVYVIQSPVSVSVGNETLAPKDVDRYVVNEAAAPLESRMAFSGEPRIDFPSWVQAFRDEMSYAHRTAIAARDGFSKPIMPVDRTQELGTIPIGPEIGPARDVFVEKLPEPPAPMIEGVRAGMTHVAEPQHIADADQQRDRDVQPVLAAGQGRDVLWTTTLFRIPTVTLAAAFREVGLPHDQYQTTVLEVILERQEILPDGNEGPVTRIKPLPTVAIPPIPADSATVAVKGTFLDWAKTNPRDILQPPFYQQIAGDIWAPPGEEVGQIAVQQEPIPMDQFDPARYLDAPHAVLMTLTLEQRRMVAELRLKKQREERQAQQRGGQRGGDRGGLGAGGLGGGGLGGGGRGGYGPNDGGRPGGGFIDPGSFEGPPPGMGEGGYMPFDERWHGQELPPHEQQQPQQWGAFDKFPLPAGDFDPRQITDGIVGWAHDDTVEAGKTYRYRITYQVKSPVWNTQNLTRPTELAQTFALKSATSAWGEPITIPTLTRFYVISPTLGGSSATVQVFRWHGGSFKAKHFNVSPGDAIGAVDGDVDFSTGWTMVDLRQDPARAERLVILMDPSGRLHGRDFQTDQRDPERLRMEKEAEGIAAAGAGPAVAGAR